MSLAVARRNRLVEIIKERSLTTGGEIKLASGRTSNFYFDMKPTMLHPEGAYLIGLQVLNAITSDAADIVGGLEMGAVPIATAIATVSHMEGRPTSAFFVRKQVKEHGKQNLIEGLPAGQTLSGRNVVVVEDVTTTGGSALRAVEAVRAAGGNPVRVVTIVDRQEGAAEAFAAAGLAFTPILTAEDFR